MSTDQSSGIEKAGAENASKSNTIRLPEWHLRELDQSLADYQANPQEGSLWADAYARILGRRPVA